MQVSKNDVLQLEESMYFLNIAELKQLTKHFNLPILKHKNDLIQNITHFCTNGKVLIEKKVQKKQKTSNINAPLTSETQMIEGVYKNGKKEREFLQKLIGRHFHFTVFGLEWLDKKWQQNINPTYQEFANMWQEEYQLFQSGQKKYYKKEWQYINFTKEYLMHNPNASHIETLQEWKKHRILHKNKVFKILNINP